MIPSNVFRPSVTTASRFVQTRQMATLKEIQLRLKSISNIAKITKSMKMIASTKMTRAQRVMEAARVYGSIDGAFFKYAEAPESLPEGTTGRTLYIIVSSDRGLCGGIHSSLAKATRARITEGSQDGLVVLGDRARTQLSRGNTRSLMVMSANNVGKNGPTFEECALIADEVLQKAQDYDQIKIIYNSFRSVIAFDSKAMSVFRKKALDEAPGLMQYEQSDEEALQNLEEFHLANALYWALAEGQASEMSARRSAMENATKNAGEMIDKLTLIFNRQRQASITNELVDIITGASAL